MGAVFRALDRQTGESVALKHVRETREGEARFFREARALALLSHPAIVRYVAHGTSQTGEQYLACIERATRKVGRLAAVLECEEPCDDRYGNPDRQGDETETQEQPVRHAQRTFRHAGEQYREEQGEQEVRPEQDRSAP